MDAVDLDAELARLEREIQKDIDPATNANAGATPAVEHVPHATGDSGAIPSPSHCPGQQSGMRASKDTLSQSRQLGQRNEAGKILPGPAHENILDSRPGLAGSAVGPHRPQWQRSVARRDAGRMHSGPREPRYPPNVSFRRALQRDAREPHTGPEDLGLQPGRTGPGAVPAHPYTTTSPQEPGGQWVWDGMQWVWHATASGVAPNVMGDALRVASASISSFPLGAQTSAGAVGDSAAELQAAAKTPRVHLRSAAGQVWVDKSLDEWPENDFRIFVGDMASDATDEQLASAFQKYPSFSKAKVITDKRTSECKGYGFVSFSKSNDMVRALREMNGKYVGSRPVKLKKSSWQKRDLTMERRDDITRMESSGIISKRRRR